MSEVWIAQTFVDWKSMLLKPTKIQRLLRPKEGVHIKMADAGSHYTGTVPTSRERVATAGIEPGTSSPGVVRSTDWATPPPPPPGVSQTELWRYLLASGCSVLKFGYCSFFIDFKGRFVCLFGFSTSSSTTDGSKDWRLSILRAATYETMSFVSAGHILLTRT